MRSKITALSLLTACLAATTTYADMVTLSSSTSEKLMPLVNRLAGAQIISVLIISVSAIICCRILKK